MVKKLFKHEIYAYLRTIIPMHLILLGVGLLGRIVQFFENDSTTYDIIFWSSVVAFCVGAVVCLLLTFIFGIRRFYQNLFTGEGYLSFTLPVTETQHIWVKNTVAVLSQIASVLMIIVASCVITFGEVCVEAFKAGGYMLKIAHEECGFHIFLYAVELIVLLYLAFSVSFMLYYACIAIGQRAKKNRVAAAIGVYFIYYFITQVLGTIAIIIFDNIDYEVIQKVVEWIEKNPFEFIHIAAGIAFVLLSVFGTICYAITKHSVSKKLNLE